MLDGMTNIKAREALKELKDYTYDLPHYSPDEVAEALEMANKALEQQPTDADCISRDQALLALTGKDLPTDRDKLIALFTERIQHLPPVTPTNADTREAYIKGYDYGVKDWFKSKTQPTEAESEDKT